MAGSAVVDDDQVVDENALRYLLADDDGEDGMAIVVQEKMDGTNVSLYFEDEWCPVLQKRSGIITSGEKAQYDVFREWVYERMDELYALLGKRQYVLFGEWLWCQHAVHYDRLPSYFLGFDLFDIAQRRFLSYDRMQRILDGRVPVVPLLWHSGHASSSSTSSSSSSSTSSSAQSKFEELKKCVGQEMMKKPSAHGGEVMEGVYVRVEQGGWVKDRFKMRRKTFTAGREGFTTNIKNNALLTAATSSSSSAPAPEGKTSNKKPTTAAASGKGKGRGGKK